MLKGFTESITTVFLQTSVQTCIVHLTGFSLNFYGWKDRQKVAVATELRATYRAETAQAAKIRLAEFEAGPWGKKFPHDRPELAAQLGEQVIPFFTYPPEIRKMIYTIKPAHAAAQGDQE